MDAHQAAMAVFAGLLVAGGLIAVALGATWLTFRLDRPPSRARRGAPDVSSVHSATKIPR